MTEQNLRWRDAQEPRVEKLAVGAAKTFSNKRQITEMAWATFSWREYRAVAAMAEPPLHRRADTFPPIKVAIIS